MQKRLLLSVFALLFGQSTHGQEVPSELSASRKGTPTKEQRAEMIKKFRAERGLLSSETTLEKQKTKDGGNSSFKQASRFANVDLMSLAPGEDIPNMYIVRLQQDETLNVSEGNYEAAKNQIQQRAEALFQKNGITGAVITQKYAASLQGVAVIMSASDAQKLSQDASVASIGADQKVSLYESNRKKTKGFPVPSTTAAVAPPTANIAQITPWGITRIGGAGDGTGKVAWVVDSGSDPTHPDLNVDAARGTSFVDWPTEWGWDIYDEPFINDLDGHGTHVSGTIGAKNNGIGVVGVAANATIIPVKVLDGYGDGLFSWSISAFDYIAARGKAGDVVNYSVGPRSRFTLEALEWAIRRVAAKGITLCLAAGNSNDDTQYYTPARMLGEKNVLVISAVDNTDTRASFSNYGKSVIYAEPGVGILSTTPMWYIDYGYYPYGSLSGTSMASPHAAGLALLGGIGVGGRMKGDPDGAADAIGVRPFTSAVLSASINTEQNCSGTTLSAVPNNSASYYYQWFNDANQLVGTNATFNAPWAGTFYVIITDPVTNKQGRATATVSMGGSLDVSVNVENSCDGSTLTASLSGPSYAFSWFDANGTKVGTQQSYKATASGTYSLLVEFGKCTGRALGKANIGGTLSAPIVEIEGSAAVCPSDKITLKIKDPLINGNYVWYDHDMKQIGTGLTITNLNANGTYHAKLVNGVCSSEASAMPTITLKNTPAVSFKIADGNPICAGTETVVLSGQTPTGGAFSGKGVTGTNFNTVTAEGNTEISYTVQDETSGCLLVATQQAVVKTAPAPKISVKFDNICANSTGSTLYGGNPTGGVWSAKDGSVLANGYTFVPKNGTTADVITYSVTDKTTGCSGKISQNVTFLTPPTVTLTDSKICSTGGIVDMTGGSPSGGLYGGTAITNNKFDPSKVSENTWSVYYLYTDPTTKCTGYATAKAIVSKTSCSPTGLVIGAEDMPEEWLFIPDGVSPNGDGINDFLSIENKTTKPIDIQLFSMQGRLIYENTNYMNTFNAQNLTEGNYVLSVIIDGKHKSKVILIQK